MVLEEGPATSRLFVFLIGGYLKRIDYQRRSICFGDLDLARIAEIIGIASVEPGMRHDAFRRAHSVLKPGTLQDTARQAAFACGIQETVLLMNEALQQGLVRWSEPQAGSVPRRK